MKKILVTGGAGYIGTHTCKHLAQNGFIPIAYDNLSTGNKELVKYSELVIGDILDGDKLIETINYYQPKAIIHFAASSYVGESVHNPLKYYHNNVSGTVSLLQAMQKTLLDKLVFSSSCAIFGNPVTETINENHQQIPVNPYGRSKLMVEKIMEDFSNSQQANYQFNYVSLRYFNAAGADSEGDLGEWHNPETHLIPLAIASAYGGSPLKIFGNNYDTKDKTAVRDYIHVEDLARAHVLALDYLLAGNKSIALNLGSGRGVSILEIIKLLQEKGLNPQYKFDKPRLGDPACLVSDCNRAKSLLGWNAHCSIDEILDSAIKWYLKQHNIKK